jgi:hypothetical protein
VGVENVDDVNERFFQRLEARRKKATVYVLSNQPTVQLTGLELLFNGSTSLGPYKDLGEALYRDVK